MTQTPQTPLKSALACKCPQCGEGDLYVSRYTLTIRENCSVCGLELAENDNGDGPAVFLIFILGFLLVPMALIFEKIFSPPLWVHAVLWTVVTLGLTLGSLRPLKTWIIALQFKHRPGEWLKK